MVEPAGVRVMPVTTGARFPLGANVGSGGVVAGVVVAGVVVAGGVVARDVVEGGANGEGVAPF